MAVIKSLGGGGNVTNLANAQAGNGASTNVLCRRTDRGTARPALLRVNTAVGATPTCTYQIEGSADGTNWFPLGSYDTSAAASTSGATFTITAAGTAWRVVPADLPWTFLRVTFSANTNVTNTVDVWDY